MDPFKPYQPKTRPTVTAPPSRDQAAALALRAVMHLAGDESLLSRFVALTGCGLDDFKSRIAEDSFLAAVLDFLLSDEAALLAFTEADSIAPDLPRLARMVLAGHE